MRANRFVSATAKLTVTVLLLALVFRHVRLTETLEELRALEKGRIVLLLLVWWGGQLLCAQRWRLFADSLGMKLPYHKFAQMYFVGMLFNIGLPSLVGGDVIKAYVLSRRTGRPIHSGMAAVLQDRAAGLLTLVIYGTLAALLMPLRWRGIPLGLAYVPIWAGLVAVAWLVFWGQVVYRRFLRPENKSPAQRLLRRLSDFHQDLATMRLAPGAGVQVILYSFLNSALVLWMFRQVAVAAGQPITIVGFSLLFPIIALVTMFPISMGGIGLREWAYVEGLALLGVQADKALTIALATSALHIVANLAGALFLPTVPLELRRASQPDAAG